MVWDEFCKFIESQKFLSELQNKVKVIHKNNDEESERGKLKAKLYGVSSQLDALAERLSVLPKTVSATPIFKQMEKLELVKKELEEGLLKIKDLNIDERLVPIETFEKFAEFAGHIIKSNPDFNIRRSLLQKFIHRVEIGVDSIKIYWNLDKDFYEQELKIKNPEKNRVFLKTANFGSHSLTIGARVAEVEEPLFGAKSILFEFEVDEVAEPKALSTQNLMVLIKRHGSFAEVARSIGASEAFVRQNSKPSKIRGKFSKLRHSNC